LDVSSTLTEEKSEEVSESLEKENLLLLLRKGMIEKFNKIRNQSMMKRIDLRGISLGHSTIEGADLSNAVLINSDFTGATLRDIKFEASYLARVYFRETTCEGIDFTNADLRGANFRDSKLLDVDFSGANLVGAKFENVEGDNVFISDSTQIDSTTNFKNSNLKEKLQKIS